MEAVNQTIGQKVQKTLDGGTPKASRSGRNTPRGSGSTANDDGDGGGGGETAFRALPGGGMEHTFVPATTSAQDAADDARLQAKAQRRDKQTRARIDAGRVGAGLEKASGAAENARAQAGLREEDRDGRKKIRRGVRSASRNVTRGL